MNKPAADIIIEAHPRLYHMAHAGSWQSIERHGLLSTCALLDLFQVTPTQRDQLSGHHRPESVTLNHPVHGSATIRDQKPMSDGALSKCLTDNLTPADWYELLNKRVFFWPTESRLYRMSKARTYTGQKHLFIVVNTASLLQKHYDKISLSRINSGSTLFKPQPRGLHTFLPADQYPLAERAKSGSEMFAELVVNHSVPDIVDHVTEVHIGKDTEWLQKIFPRVRSCTMQNSC